jgi:hypothetical protein
VNRETRERGNPRTREPSALTSPAPALKIPERDGGRASACRNPGTAMRRPSFLALAACLLVWAPLVGSSDEGSASFVLGVLRRDAILVPFASFDGRRWTNDWPMPPKKVDVPITLDDVPAKWWPDDTPRLDWTLWTPDGDHHPLTLTAPAWTPVECEGLVGLRTGYQLTQPVPPPVVQPYPKIGLAVSGAQRVEPIDVVIENSAEWGRIAALVKAQFDGAETDAVRWNMRGGWYHPVGEAARAARPITVEALYRAPWVTPGSFVYYVEAVRRYHMPFGDPDQPCDLLTFASGWVEITRNGASKVDLRASLTDCQRYGITALLPLGLLRVDGRCLWVGQWSGWETENYAVVEIEGDGAAKTLISTRAGSCR